MKKGNEIIVEGELYTNTYQTDSGENRHNIRLNVNQVHFTYGNNKTNDTTNEQPKMTPVLDEGLPF